MSKKKKPNKDSKNKIKQLDLDNQILLSESKKDEKQLRKEAKAALEKLKAQGKKLILATGDTLVRTEELVKDLPFDQVYTDLKPDGKFELVEDL